MSGPASNAHRRMIASLGPDIPHALLAGSGRYAGLLEWQIDRDFPLAGQWLESKFPLWAFSVVEDWAQGKLDHLECVVFSRGDDAAQRLYYYLCELQARGLVGGPEPLILDVARIPRPPGEDRCVAALRKLADRLGIGHEAVRQATMANALSASSEQPAAFPEGNVCLLAGTLPPDQRLHVAIAQAGWTASGKTMREAWSVAAEVTAVPDADPLVLLGRTMHQSRMGARSFHARAGDLAGRATAAGAKAAVLWYAEEDEAEVWNLPAQKAALAALAIPTLVLTRRSWRADDGAAEEIAQFLKEFDR